MFLAHDAPIIFSKSLVKDLWAPIKVFVAPRSLLWPLGVSLRSFCVLLGPSWVHFGAILDHLGPFWGHVRSLLEPSSPILALSGALLGHFWTSVWPPGASLGPCRTHLAPSWFSLGSNARYCPYPKKQPLCAPSSPSNRGAAVLALAYSIIRR